MADRRTSFRELLERAMSNEGSARQLFGQYDTKRAVDPDAVQMSRFFEGMAAGEAGVPHLSLPFVPSDSPELAALVAGGYEGAKAIAEQGPMARRAVNSVIDLLPGATELRMDATTSPADIRNPIMYMAGHGRGRLGRRDTMSGRYADKIGRLLAKLQ